MSQSLPTGEFKWLKDINKETVLSILDKMNNSMLNPSSRKGYVFEVDLEYPTYLWDSHNDYSLIIT